MIKPIKEELINKSVNEIVLIYDVSKKTVIRWMKFYNLFQPTKNFGSKLNMSLANEIRQRYKNGSKIKDLAKEYHVTNSSISRIINNINYSTYIPSNVSVIYNIN